MTAANASTTADAAPATAACRLALNETDLAIRYVDRALRRFGYPGFETQAIIWLDRRLDAERLRQSLAQLSRRHPIVASRLVETEGESRRHWQFRPDAACPLREVALAASNRAAVLEEAGRLLSAPHDPREHDPIRFYLLRAAGGGDVFLMQYNHTLLDNNAALLLLREIGQPAAGEAAAAPLDGQVLIRAYLRRFPRPRRREALKRGVSAWAQSTRGGAVMVGRRADGPCAEAPLRLAARELAEPDARALRDWATRACGFPSVSMAVLGTAFRAIDRLAPRPRAARAKFLAGIGIDLGLRGKGATVFQNLMSIVPIHAREEELADRGALAQHLSGQLRQHLAEDIDLGVMQATALFNRQSRYLEAALEHTLRHSFSLWYAYFGALDRLGEEFCGARIEDVRYFGPSWSPNGLTLLVNQYRRKLMLQVTYAPSSVTTEQAEEFLDLVVRDLA